MYIVFSGEIRQWGSFKDLGKPLARRLGDFLRRNGEEDGLRLP